MPSSGFPMEDMTDENQENWKVIQDNCEHAIKMGLFGEWLECFVGTYNYLKAHPEEWETHACKNTSDVANVASAAGIIEWDM